MLDFIMVPLGLMIMAAYHIWLLHKIIKQPTTTMVGIHAINRRLWVHAMMEVKQIIFLSKILSFSRLSSHDIHLITREIGLVNCMSESSSWVLKNSEDFCMPWIKAHDPFFFLKFFLSMDRLNAIKP